MKVTSEGSIQGLGRGKYRVSVSFGRDPATNKYRRKTKIVHGTKADAIAERDRIKQEINAGMRVDVDHVTYSQMLDMWAESKRAEGAARAETISKYMESLIKITAIRAAHP